MRTISKDGLAVDVVLALRELQREAAQAAIELATEEPTVLPRDYATALREERVKLADIVAHCGSDDDFMSDSTAVNVLLRALANGALLHERNAALRTALQELHNHVRMLKVLLVEVDKRRLPQHETVPFTLDDFARFHQVINEAGFTIAEVL